VVCSNQCSGVSSTKEGDTEALALFAGQGVGLVNRVQPAAEIVRDIAAEARETIQSLAARL
jgi:nitronate monooxygenase